MLTDENCSYKLRKLATLSAPHPSHITQMELWVMELLGGRGGKA